MAYLGEFEEISTTPIYQDSIFPEVRTTNGKPTQCWLRWLFPQSNFGLWNYKMGLGEKISWWPNNTYSQKLVLTGSIQDLPPHRPQDGSSDPNCSSPHHDYLQVRKIPFFIRYHPSLPIQKLKQELQNIGERFHFIPILAFTKNSSALTLFRKIQTKHIIDNPRLHKRRLSPSSCQSSPRDKRYKI